MGVGLLISSVVLMAFGPQITEMELSNGIPVISRKLDTGQVEGVSLFIDGGSRLLTEDTQGIEAFAIECALMGGGRFSGPALRQLTDTTLAEIAGQYNYDFSRIHLRCLDEDLPLLMDALSDCLLDPELDPASVERVRQSMLADLAEQQSDPDQAIWYVCNRGFMIGHPYSLKPDGVPETVAALTADDADRHLQRRLVSGNLLITHAGSTPDSVLLPLLEAAFGGLPTGGETLADVPPFPLEEDTLVAESREVETAYAVVKFAAPPAGHRDRAAFMAGMSAISDLLWDVLRTENNLTYGTYAGSTSYRRNWGYMYVSSPQPQRACSLMADVYRNALLEGLDADLVRGSAETMRTGRGARMASRDYQCYLLGVGAISGEGWKSSYFMVDSLAALDSDEVREALSRWAGPCSWGVIASDEQLENLKDPWPIR